MITEVDEEARTRELEHLRSEMLNVIEERVADIRPRREKLESATRGGERRAAGEG